MRRVVVILVLLLAGAVVNVAVAWGCALWICNDNRTDWVGAGFSAPDAPCWAFHRLERIGSTALTGGGVASISPDPDWRYAPDLVPKWSRMLARPPDKDVERYRMIEYARGWPFLTLSCAFTRMFDVPGFAVVDGLHVKPHLDPSRAFASSIALPLRPIWPGFAANTLLYAAILWLLICGPFVLRRHIRVMQGFCPSCAYPMGASPTCTECGKALPGRAEAVT